MGRSSFLERVAGGVLVLIGLVLLFGGAWLALLGGSLYYLIAALACMSAGVLTIAGRPVGTLVYAIFLFFTVGWALFEAGLQFWPLLPRLAGPAVVGGALFALLVVRRSGSRRDTAIYTSGAAALAALLVLGVSWFVTSPSIRPSGGIMQEDSRSGRDAPQEWNSYGNSPGGTRFSPAGQITRANVAQLQPAWSYRTGDSNALRPDIKTSMSFMATPLMVDDKVLFCTPTGAVIALNADSGKQLWRHDPRADPGAAQMLNCRGVSYHDSGLASPCSRRVMSTTADGRLIALDLNSGKRCAGFGNGGTISLAQGLGRIEQGATYTTSPPAIIGNAAVLGAYVRDNFSSNEPSGVVRAFDVTTGDLLWAWDSGRPDGSPPLRDGETYTRGSPNAWSVFSADPDLGLIYVPTGNATPDHVGLHRTALQERYASSVVALDAQTGAVRWHFQTTHKDLWDYDVPAQPVLFDFPAGAGAVPAVAVPTKRGEIFILDRRTGEPLLEIEERSAPQGDIPGETYSRTQPYQIGFPSLAPNRLREADMWGATPLDQLWCRVAFRTYDYSGDFTPPSTRGAIQYPGIFGMLNWGSVSIDERTGLMLANSSAIPQIVTLHPKEKNEGDKTNAAASAHVPGYLPQDGTPYGLTMEPMLSPIGIPCQSPPWGHLTAIDLAKREIAWRRPFGTTRDIAPLGIAVPGVFNIGGSVVTAGGLTFIGAALDDYLRAFDTATGAELWRARLPAGGQATPMSYVSSRTGRQYVVIAAGGHGFLGSTLGDYVIAFALPRAPSGAAD